MVFLFLWVGNGTRMLVNKIGGFGKDEGGSGETGGCCKKKEMQ